MREALLTNSQIAAAVAKRPAGYLDEFERCVIHRDSEGAWVDADSAEWKAMKEKYAPMREAERAKRIAERKAKRDEATREMWRELHGRSLTYVGDADAEQAWLAWWSRRVPCGDCQIHWMEIIKGMPPGLSSAETYFAWTVAAHNAVNRRIGKPEWTVEQALVIVTRQDKQTPES